ncbi:Ribosomal-protein-S18p-alanine acetyltransferase [Enhygromyxa salina]|uniref:Ribosomal-protein-S18p-alanine acetyltransferase n=1 Tax=Enhygromyxa salina TaxID=215803 RepID=A0A0C1ZUE6_9BACT|nr:Ribosomal-protein-S18p-alanine acetyltransferase [Enhygromyxa salina]
MATLEDLTTLDALDAACFARPWGAAGWRAAIEGGGIVLLAGVPARGLACAQVILESCELRRIGVEPGARRSGLARSLLRSVIAHARRAGCERIQLEVAEGNVAARSLYRAHGFGSVGRRPGYYRDPPDAALLMDLEIGPKS